MEFIINRNPPYKELKVRGDSFTAETGLMYKGECVTLAIELLEAANDLLLDTNYEAQTDTLVSIIEYLKYR